MNEQWKDVEGFPGYRVSDMGRVIGPRFNKPLRGGLASGYLYVTLCKSGVHSQIGIHQLVAAAFCEGCQPKFEPNHINGIKTDNRAENLEWKSRSDNQKHAHDIGLKKSGERSHLCTKLCAADVLEIRRLQGSKPTSHIAKLFGVSQTYVWKIHNRLKWRQLKEA